MDFKWFFSQSLTVHPNIIWQNLVFFSRFPLSCLPEAYNVVFLFMPIFCWFIWYLIELPNQSTKWNRHQRVWEEVQLTLGWPTCMSKLQTIPYFSFEHLVYLRLWAVFHKVTGEYCLIHRVGWERISGENFCSIFIIPHISYFAYLFPH